ncbi:MAG TPA: carbohydrate ABC transporter permease [Clostridia bacterium]|nr:carbohydrate ABC transporter permease [Clostridia bacterium]
MRYKETKGEKAFHVINAVVLAVLTFAFFYPVWFCLVSSFSDPQRLIGHKGAMLVPLGFSLAGYDAVLHNKNILIGYANTLFYVGMGTAIGFLLTLLGAYFMSRKSMMLKKPLTFVVILTMYVSAGLIPHFLLVRSLGLYDTRWAVILPSVINTYNMIVMRTAIMALPDSLEESAMLDGAGELTILFRIILPLIKATVAVIILFFAVAWWNAWFNAAIYIRDRSKYPLQLFLREILIASTTDGNDGAPATSDQGVYYLEAVIKYSAIIISTVPILCAYPFVQKYFVQGMMLGSLKG